MKSKLFTYLMVLVITLSGFAIAQARTTIIIKRKRPDMQAILHQIPPRYYTQPVSRNFYNFTAIGSSQQFDKLTREINKRKKSSNKLNSQRQSNQRYLNSRSNKPTSPLPTDNPEGSEETAEFYFDLAQDLRTKINNGDFRGAERKDKIESMIGYYNKAKDLNYAPASTELGYIYLVDKYEHQKPDRAFRLFEEGAKAGDVTALYYLGRCHLNGEGTPTNEKKAFTTYKEGSDRGELNCQVKLGLCYFNGWGTEKDYSKAVECFENVINSPDNDYVSKSNFGDAHFTLYKIYNEGGYGIQKDEDKAKEHLHIAYKQYGSKDAINALAGKQSATQSDKQTNEQKDDGHIESAPQQGSSNEQPAQQQDSDKKQPANKQDSDKKQPAKQQKTINEGDKELEIDPKTGNYKSGTSVPLNKNENENENENK